jgi:hypothetical protein
MAIELFWDKVEKSPEEDGCWVWTGFKDEHGRGQVRINYEAYKAHRIVWTLTKGEIPPNVEVMHLCDNPACVNPWHLSLGTHKQNMQDAVLKRRIAWGERHGMRKLTEGGCQTNSCS